MREICTPYFPQYPALALAGYPRLNGVEAIQSIRCGARAIKSSATMRSPWAASGSLPFKVLDEKQEVRHTRDYEHIVIDTPARPTPEDMKTLAQGCDLLILPNSPDAMTLSAMLQMVEALYSLKFNYRILLTVIPPAPSKVGAESRATIEKAGLPIFKANVRRLAVFQKAALAGIPVSDIKDPYAKAAWGCYATVGKEMLP